ncbi:MAG: NUDIX domain-containing protein [Bacteroidales bacterium]|nr:NUDIX domain-containing protein [Bacteroidales bacterium]
MANIHVTCAVIIKNGMVLAASRGSMVKHSGQWEFPGGMMRDGESAEACVVRRINEEMGLNIRIVEGMMPFVTKDGEGNEYEMHPFFAEVVDGRAVLTNHSRAEWFMPIQLMRLAWPETDMPIIEEIISRVMTTGRII